MQNPLGLTGGEEGLALNADALPAALVGVPNTHNLYWIRAAADRRLCGRAPRRRLAGGPRVAGQLRERASRHRAGTQSVRIQTRRVRPFGDDRGGRRRRLRAAARRREPADHHLGFYARAAGHGRARRASDAVGRGARRDRLRVPRLPARRVGERARPAGVSGAGADSVVGAALSAGRPVHRARAFVPGGFGGLVRRARRPHRKDRMPKGFVSGGLQRLVDGFARDVERGAIPGAVVLVARKGKRRSSKRSAFATANAVRR